MSRAMKLALVSPLPPLPSVWADRCLGLLEGLSPHCELVVLVENPFQISPQVTQQVAVRPVSELPKMVEKGELDLVVYLMADSAYHTFQLRYAQEFPGLLVLDQPQLEQLVAAASMEVAPGKKRFLFGELEGNLVAAGEVCAADLLRALSEKSLAVQQGEIAAQDILDFAKGQKNKAQQVECIQASAYPKAEVVVVGYNSKDIVGPCLDSILAQDYPNLRVTLVDNASADGTAAFVRDHYPSINLIESQKNLGFASGNNLVMQSSDSDYFLLLNQDAIAQPNWVRELVRVAELDPSIAAVGSKMLMDRCPTILNSTGIEINEAGWAWDRQVGEKDDNPSPLPQEVFGGCGGALMLRSAAIQKVGGLDPAFFMYFEDTDLSWRFRLAGYRNYYAPLAIVRHDFHGDSIDDPGRNLRRRFMSERNRIQTLIKNCDWKSLRQVLPRIRKYERGRLRHLNKLVADGVNPEFHRELADLIRRAWRWNILRMPSLLWRRIKVQRLRKASLEEVKRHIIPGLNEGGHQGDVEAYYDRHSAKSSDRLRMGESDQGSLGAGWHCVEQPPGAVQAYRWCKDRAWFYLVNNGSTKTVTLKIASPIEPHAVRLFVEDHKLGEMQVVADVQDLSFDLPQGLPANQTLEFRIESESLRPVDRDMGPDIRDLGIILFESWLS